MKSFSLNKTWFLLLYHLFSPVRYIIFPHFLTSFSLSFYFIFLYISSSSSFSFFFFVSYQKLKIQHSQLLSILNTFIFLFIAFVKKSFAERFLFLYSLFTYILIRYTFTSKFLPTVTYIYLLVVIKFITLFSCIYIFFSCPFHFSINIFTTVFV